jgi:hypothetical protein
MSFIIRVRGACHGAQLEDTMSNLTFEHTSNGRWKVKTADGYWIGTIAPVSGSGGGGQKPLWWYVPRGGAGHVTFDSPEGAMRRIDKLFASVEYDGEGNVTSIKEDDIK